MIQRPNISIFQTGCWSTYQMCDFGCSLAPGQKLAGPLCIGGLVLYLSALWAPWQPHCCPCGASFPRISSCMGGQWEQGGDQCRGFGPVGKAGSFLFPEMTSPNTHAAVPPPSHVHAGCTWHLLILWSVFLLLASQHGSVIPGLAPSLTLLYQETDSDGRYLVMV